MTKVKDTEKEVLGLALVYLEPRCVEMEIGQDSSERGSQSLVRVRVCICVHVCMLVNVYVGVEREKDFLGCKTGSVELKGRSWCGPSPFESLEGEGESGNRTGWRVKSLQRRVRKNSFCREDQGVGEENGDTEEQNPYHLPSMVSSQHTCRPS